MCRVLEEDFKEHFPQLSKQDLLQMTRNKNSTRNYRYIEEIVRPHPKWNGHPLKGEVKVKRRRVQGIKPLRESRPGQWRLYILRAGDFIKIGVAQDVGRRIKQLQTGSPHRIEELQSWAFADGNDALVAEARAHQACAKYAAYGEWFEIGALSIVLDHVGKGPEV